VFSDSYRYFFAANVRFRNILSATVKPPKRSFSMSTDARTEQGKTKSTLNVVKTGLTGRTVLLPADDAEQYQQHRNAFINRYRPKTKEESELVQSLADTDWRLKRIPSLEAGIYALGRLEFANKFDDQPESLRLALIQAHTFLTYQKQLNNLSVQEARLRRQYQKDAAELAKFQAESQNGFVFSTNPPKRPVGQSAGFAVDRPVDHSNPLPAFQLRDSKLDSNAAS
jgi:hypothetical protein